jgi:hypothetical protein
MGVLILYFLRNVKPEVAREDIFCNIGLLYSCILMVHGWRLDQFFYLASPYNHNNSFSSRMGKYQIKRVNTNIAKLKNKKKIKI